MAAALVLRRDQVLGHRRRAGELDARLPAGQASLERAAWAGLSDSMPRAALLAIHARVEGTQPSSWEDPALVQVWGPRFSAYVIAARDRAVFTLGRLPDDASGLERAYGIADKLEATLGGGRRDARVPGRALGMNPNMFRYAATTGRVLIRWDGAHQPTIWMVPPPDVDPWAARLELARRYLRVMGPGTASSFGDWAGIRPPRARATFERLADELTAVRAPLGDAFILTTDEASFRAGANPAAPARLLPSGDSYWLCWGADRELLVADPGRRAELWTPRVWPGALLVDGEIVGTWRRGGADLAIQAWLPLSARQRTAVEAEAAALPLPGLEGQVRARWEG
jgi:hypothetical protein